MQKTTSVLLGALVVIATVIVVLRTGPRRDNQVVVPPISSSGSIASDVAPAVSADPLKDMEAQASRILPMGRPGTLLPDGGVPGALPDDAPSELRFGVVLVTYRGAERAPANARSKDDALKLANALASMARSDFKAAVEKGDDGSGADLGWIGRGVLEPAPNFVLFTLRPGQVSEPVDSPTGFVIMKNLSK